MINFSNACRSIAIGSLFVAASCDKPPPISADPETAHCERAAQRLVRDVGKILIVESQAWSIDGMRNVRVRFQYPPNPDNLNMGNILCTYDYSLDVRSDKSRLPQLKSVYFQARYLSENELLLLNMGLRGTQPEYKVK